MLSLEQAVDLLKKGEVVAFPTETVYGLGALIDCPHALKKIFLLKKRPLHHPLIVHVYDKKTLDNLVKNISSEAHLLMTHFWPGPLTLVFEAAPGLSPLVTGGQKTIAIRMPSHPVARLLLAQLPNPVAAPSANRFGYVSPTQASHVKEAWGEKVFILDAGDCPYGIESTILDVTTLKPRLLRPGPLSPVWIQDKTGIFLEKGNVKKKANTAVPRVSGQLASHYRPYTPLRLYEKFDAVFLEKNIPETLAFMAFGPKPAFFTGTWISMPSVSFLYASVLYTQLRRLDKQGFSAIYIQKPPEKSEWQAVYDRLRRASAL